MYPLNLLDLLFTLYAIHLGIPEANPFMRCVPVMVLYKVVIVGVACWWLSKREEPIARYGLKVCTVLYAVLCFYHAINIFEVILW